MTKLNTKSLFTIIILLLIGIVAVWRINQGPKKVEAGWWNESWMYRKAITLTNSGTGQTDVYVLLTIDTSDTTRFQADGGDIRFTKQNGELLPYYIVSGAGTASTVVHINFDIYPAGDSTFYLYYGNSNADNGFSASDFTTQASNSSTNLLDEELSPAPIAYWSFNEGTGTTVYDSSHQNNHREVVGADWSESSDCVSGTCLYFNGNGTDYINTGIGQNRDISVDPLSISMWVKPISPAANLMYLSPNQGTNQRFYFATYGGKWDMGIQNSTWGGGGSGVNVDMDKWSHINIVADGSKVHLFLNGKKIMEKSHTSYTFPFDIHLGQHGPASSYSFRGYIDEVKIYNYARTATQIKQDYNAGLASISSMKGGSVNVGGTQVRNIKDHLVAHYKFDEGYGNTINNFSSLGTTLNGTLGSSNSAPSWTTGKINKGLLFDGNDYIDLPNDLTYTNGVSAFAWFKSLGDPPGGYHIIFGGSQLEISIPSSGQIRTGINTSTRYVSNHGSGITDGNWHYVGFTFDGSTKNSYIDGEYVGQQTGIEGTLVNSFSSRRIGRFGSSSTYFANGLIDEVKIYNTALTDAEIKLDYNQGSQFVMGKTNQTIGGTTTSLEYCIPGDTTHCAPPVAEYKFDEGIGTTAFDTSGNNNNLRSYNNFSWTIGKIGKAVQFTGSGSQYFEITDSDSSTLDINGNITAEAWVNFNELKDYGIILQKGSGGSASTFNYAIWSYDNRIVCYFADGNNLNASTINSSDISLGQWHHIACVANGSNIIAYLDGRPYDTNPQTISPTSNNYSFYISHNSYTPNAKIDQVKIYNYARTPAQIAYDYNKGAPVGWWKFDECEGTTINDWSGNANHGTLTIGVGGSQSSVGTCSIGNTSAWSNGATGKINSAMSFDGTDDYVNCGNDDLYSYSDGNTFSMWVYGTGRFSEGATLLNRQGQTNSGFYWLMIYQNKGFLQYYNGSNNVNIMTTNVLPVSLNKWFHYTVVVDGETVSFYIDGNFIESKQATNIEKDKITSNLYIGCYQQWNSNWQFKGNLDDVRIYNYALTAEQVKQVYNGGAVNFR